MTRSRSMARRKKNMKHKQSARNQDGNNKDGDKRVMNDGYHTKPHGYKLTIKENKVFEEYYKMQCLVPENEWDAFMDALKRPLPSTFRITGYVGQAKDLLRIVKSDYLNQLVEQPLSSGEASESPMLPPVQLPWYPEGLAWQLDLDRKMIKQSDTLKKLHNFLIQETESGYISRQEAVSMIPPLVLDVKQHHKVLDMCAAPGSKTAQLIEMLHSDITKPIPDGFVVANDADNKRCYLMAHQVKRLPSPSFVIVNHDASSLPNMRITPEGENREWLKYDRVLADVPCSGDGTMRKNPDVWRKWTPGPAHSLHGLQCRILHRGIQLLTVGGRLVYSTCSFNPIEDEAVVSNLLREAEGSVELLDVSSLLPGLKYKPGLTQWKVRSREGVWFERFSEVPERLHTQVRPSMFPPTTEELEKFNIDRCMRVMPHLQDTGGFFVAVFSKTKEVPWASTTASTATRKAKTEADSTETSESTEMDVKDEVAKCDTAPQAEETNGAGSEATPAEGAVAMETETPAEDNKVTSVENEQGTTGEIPAEAVDGNESKRSRKRQRRRRDNNRSESPPPLKQQRLHGYREDPFIYLSQDDPIWPPIREYFALREDFPAQQALVRCAEGKKRNIYFSSASIRDLVLYNADKVRFINLGQKVLSRSDSQYVSCDFRMVQEGIESIFPYQTTRIIKVTKEDIITLLTVENPFLERLCNETRDQLSDLDQGGCTFVYEPDGRPDSPCSRLVICGWKGKASCRSFMAKSNRAHYLRLCGAELKTREEIKEQPMPKTQGGSEVKVDNDGAAGVKDRSDGDTTEGTAVDTEVKVDVKDQADDTVDSDVPEDKKQGSEIKTAIPVDTVPDGEQTSSPSIETGAGDACTKTSLDDAKTEPERT